MKDTANEYDRQEISLLESLDDEWLKLPLTVMRDVGPTVQTLGGLLKVTKKETYAAVTKISTEAYLPVQTVRRHLRALDKAGWIKNRGREHTGRGQPRRTATLAITSKTLRALDGDANSGELVYGVLPCWACYPIKRVGKLPWSAKAVLSVVMARLMSLKAAAEREGNHVGDEELIGAIENMGGDDRFCFSLAQLVRQTGLIHDSVTAAKRYLRKVGIISRKKRKCFDSWTAADLLVPDWDFRAVTSASGERWWVDFQILREK
ncbi:MAG: hypothetical protein WCB27_00560 [Thermoguttaceae bacterium]